jgi:hypothetical protein
MNDLRRRRFAEELAIRHPPVIEPSLEPAEPSHRVAEQNAQREHAADEHAEPKDLPLQTGHADIIAG